MDGLKHKGQFVNADGRLSRFDNPLAGHSRGAFSADGRECAAACEGNLQLVENRVDLDGGAGSEDVQAGVSDEFPEGPPLVVRVRRMPVRSMPQKPNQSHVDRLLGRAVHQRLRARPHIPQAHSVHQCGAPANRRPEPLHPPLRKHAGVRQQEACCRDDRAACLGALAPRLHERREATCGTLWCGHHCGVAHAQLLPHQGLTQYIEQPPASFQDATRYRNASASRSTEPPRFAAPAPAQRRATLRLPRIQRATRLRCAPPSAADTAARAAPPTSTQSLARCADHCARAQQRLRRALRR